MARRPPGDEGLRWSTRGGNRGGTRVGEWLVAIFGLGVFLFSPLVIQIFDRGIRAAVLGVPLLYFYLFGAWALLIALIALVIESQGDRPGRRTAEPARHLPAQDDRS